MPSNEERRVKILQYVMDRQRAKQRTTKAEVIRYMRGDSAVNTTHHLIMELIREGKLNVEVLNSQVHFLTTSENYDLPQYERELLVKAITETHSYFENMVGENDSLVNFLKAAINDEGMRSDIRGSYLGIPDIDDNVQYKIVFKDKTRRKRRAK